MNKNYVSKPLSLRNITVTDAFWKNEMELVRKEVIPYQWNALNDRVPGAAPSFCMRNFKLAGKITRARRELGKDYNEKVWPLDTFETLPEDMNNMEDRFYGFLFQDSDFSKWIEAVAYSLTQHPDADLEKTADEAIDIVCAAQQENGYLDTYYIINDMSKVFTNLRDNHELYCLGHLTEGAVAYYQATGKTKLLNAAEKYADYIVTCIGIDGDRKKGYPGHEIAEMALVRLYEATGNSSYLELSQYFIDERGKRPYYFDIEHPENVKKGHENEVRYEYNQAHLPVREQKEAVGHAVRAVYLYSGMADIARLTGDEKLYKVCRELFDNIARKKMYITGGVGGTNIGEAFSFNYDLPNDTAYAETCASIGLVFFARRMLEIEADSKYADVMERALFNGILSGMALDGKSFFYVNPLEVNPEACHKDQRKEHVKPVRQKWFGCACCPPNIARLVSSIASYAYTENDTTLYIHQYIGSKIDNCFNNHLNLSIESGFPWKGNVKIAVTATSSKDEYTLAFRLPYWCESYLVNGQRGIFEGSTVIDGLTMRVEKGYLYVTNQWKTGDVIELNFNMNIRLIAADGRVREDIGKVAVTRGPIVYCLEEADNGSNLHMLALDTECLGETYESDCLDNKMQFIRMNGGRIIEKDCGLYYDYHKPEYEPCKLTFIPYYAWANRGEGEMQVWSNVKIK